MICLILHRSLTRVEYITAWEQRLGPRYLVHNVMLITDTGHHVWVVIPSKTFLILYHAAIDITIAWEAQKHKQKGGPIERASDGGRGKYPPWHCSYAWTKPIIAALWIVNRWIASSVLRSLDPKSPQKTAQPPTVYTVRVMPVHDLRNHQAFGTNVFKPN